MKANQYRATRMNVFLFHTEEKGVITLHVSISTQSLSRVIDLRQSEKRQEKLSFLSITTANSPPHLCTKGYRGMVNIVSSPAT